MKNRLFRKKIRTSMGIDDDKYEAPVQLVYSWSCPYDGGHQRIIHLPKKPDGRSVIGYTECWNFEMEDPLIVVKMYGNLRLTITKKKVTSSGKSIKKA